MLQSVHSLSRRRADAMRILPIPLSEHSSSACRCNQHYFRKHCSRDPFFKKPYLTNPYLTHCVLKEILANTSLLQNCLLETSLYLRYHYLKKRCQRIQYSDRRVGLKAPRTIYLLGQLQRPAAPSYPLPLLSPLALQGYIDTIARCRGGPFFLPSYVHHAS